MSTYKMYKIVLKDDEDMWSLETTREKAEKEVERLNNKYAKFLKFGESFYIVEKEV